MPFDKKVEEKKENSISEALGISKERLEVVNEVAKEALMETKTVSDSLLLAYEKLDDNEILLACFFMGLATGQLKSVNPLMELLEKLK